ncbi:MAG: 50S ribosomal protein L3 [Endomicrobium sp.]|jgi:large subunit ribosomal protein L3|nr:50S ribosomal protein L3 [Endomicrobium sp.]
MLKSIIGEKIGMTQVFDARGNVVPVTIIKAGPCVITGLRTVEKDGYLAVQLGFGEVLEKSLVNSQVNFFKKNNVSPKKVVREFRVTDVSAFSIGQEIKVSVFKVGDYVDVSALTKGKGYAGVIKRHNFSMQPVSHGQSDRTRARGSSGSAGHQKVFKGMKMSGHLGNECVTIQKLLVVNVDVEKSMMLIRGSVPAVKSGTLLISNTLKKIPAVQQEVKAKARTKVGRK